MPFDVNRPSAINKLVNDLKRWTRNRSMHDLKSPVLEEAVQVCETHLACLGFKRDGNNITREVPMMSLGIMEQVQQTLEAAYLFSDDKHEPLLNVACVNMNRLMREAHAVNDFATQKERDVAEAQAHALHVSSSRIFFPPND